jgi:predicted ATPase
MSVDGFKSLHKLSIEIRPLTVLIGLNSSGKSSVLQVLEVLKQSVMVNTYNLVTRGHLANLGSVGDILSKNKGKKELEIAIGGKRAQFLDPPFSRNTEYGYSFTIDTRGMKSYSATIKSGQITLGATHERRMAHTGLKIEFSKGTISFSKQMMIGRPFRYDGAEGLEEGFDYDSITQRFLEVIALDLKDFRLVPAMRGVSSTSFPLEASSSEDLVDSSNLYAQTKRFVSTVVYESPSIERKVNKWINRITGVTIKARTVPDKQGSIEASRNYEVNLVNEGFGTNQLVHMFAQVAQSSVNSIIGIEEPEVHLHPKAQSELAKVLIEIVKEENKRLILTTHSEHILYRILIEVAKGTLKPEDLAIYHFKLSGDGVTQVERLKPDEKGRLDKGIPDFLETDLDEFKDFLEALKV